MTRPTTKIRRLVAFAPVLLITALMPITLMGIFSTPGETLPSKESATNIDALMKHVMKLNEKKQHEKAIEALLSALDNQKDDPIMRTLLLQTFDLFLEEEIKVGQMAIEKNPLDKSAYARVSGAFELLGDHVRAMEVLLNGIYHDLKSPDLWMKIARLELKADRDREALDVFREVIRLDKKNSDAYNNAAHILASSTSSTMRELKEAEALANKARKLAPKNPDYLDTLAEVQYKQGNRKAAQSLMEEAIKLAPERDSFKVQLKRFRDEANVVAE